MNKVKRGAFLTMDSLDGFFCYDHLTYIPLARMGWEIEEVSWRRQNVCWDDYDLVVIRSPWDYSNHPQEFMRVLEQIDCSKASLANPLSIVRWNLDKVYLRALETQGIPIVPTLWLKKLTQDDIATAFEHFAATKLVLKPTLGAGARNTFRLARGASAERAVQALQTQPVMVQPYLDSIVELGEYSLFYFGGDFSHCVRKLPKPGDFRVQEEHGGLISSCPAPPSLLEAAQRVLDAIGGVLLYARVDFVWLSADIPVVIEVELIEPSLYFNYDERSPDRFAYALDRMYRGHPETA
jgi:glutathione synthase/RimK-type ligase-like ATP-grasp enzyme